MCLFWMLMLFFLSFHSHCGVAFFSLHHRHHLTLIYSLTILSSTALCCQFNVAVFLRCKFFVCVYYVSLSFHPNNESTNRLKNSAMSLNTFRVRCVFFYFWMENEGHCYFGLKQNKSNTDWLGHTTNAVSLYKDSRSKIFRWSDQL